MAFIHHPVFQSLLLPLFWGGLLVWLLKPTGVRWLVMAPSLALVLSLAFWPGFVWPALAHAQMLPWLALGSAAALSVVVALRSTGPKMWEGRLGLWAAVFLVLAGLAMAAWGALGGSLLLAQLAMMLSSVSAVAVWQAWRMRVALCLGLLPLCLFAGALALSLAGLSSGGAADASLDDPYFTRP